MASNSFQTGEPGRLTYFIIAGEESGDLHGARLVESIRRRQDNINFIGFGGDQMRKAGVELLEHSDNLAVIGFTEVLKHLSFFRELMDNTVEKISKLRPERIILIDYPGFNLRLIKKISRLGIPITYFILPQVWAWKEKRVKILQKHIDQALCIFPFEEKWFLERGVPASYVGHPFSEGLPASLSRQDFYIKHGLSENEKLLVLFPGSRQQEVDRHWPYFLAAAQKITKNFPNTRIVVGKAPAVDLNPLPDDVVVEKDDPRLAMKYGQAVLVASGTATLEAAVQNIPAVVGYRLSPLSFLLVRLLVKVKFASMVNLIAGRKVVPELLQNNFTSTNLYREAAPLMEDSGQRQAILDGMKEVRSALGEPGAYDRAAALITG